MKNIKKFYGKGGTSKSIIKILRKLEDKNLFQKKFFNI